MHATIEEAAEKPSEKVEERKVPELSTRKVFLEA